MKTSVQKTFVVGDEWLYYKIYCGVKTADILLLEIIKPVTAALLKEGIINKWFFIRYTDPAPHIRFRLQLTTQDALGAVILNIKNRLKPYVMHAQIWEVQLATYQR
jgi:thiopeptide-type bacteriocin biosynthesis protein